MVRLMLPQNRAEDWYLDLVLLNTILAVCRLESGEQIPAWAMEGEFMSVTRTADELSVVCRASAVPADTECETGWRIFKVEGVLDFALTGVLCSVVKPLAEAGVSIFSLSTYNSDYVMVKEENIEKAVGVLTAAGHRIKRN